MTATNPRTLARAIRNAVRASFLAVVLAVAGSPWGVLGSNAASVTVTPDVPAAVSADKSDPLAKGGRFGTGRKAVIGYWSGTRVC